MQESHWLNNAAYQEHGIDKVWRENGEKMAETNWDTGISIGWYSGGKIYSKSQIIKSKNLKMEAGNQFPEIHATTWYENGQKMSETNSLSSGIHQETEWHKNGQKKRDEAFKNGRMIITEWDENGNIISESN
jgi:antitoxin component YwqK of YwqJK toxin-antitoxin module